MNELLSAFHISSSKNGKQLLEDITFTLHKGEIMGFIPLDNQGFDEFFHLLDTGNGIERGKLTFYSQKKGFKNSNIAFIGKRPRLIPALSLEENFYVIRRNAPYLVRKKQMRMALSAIRAEYGIDAECGKVASSIDEKTRCKVEMIKAVELGYPLVVLFDLASFLGPKDAREIQSLMKRLSSERATTFIYVSRHHEELVGFCDRIMMMSNGSIIYIGPPDEYDDRLINAVSGRFLGTYQRLRKEHHKEEGKAIGSVAIGKNVIPLMEGSCSVILDFDNHAPKDAYDSLCGKSSPVSFFIKEKRCTLSDRRISFIPSNPLLSLCPEMSYFDNLCLRASEKIPFFWQRKGRFLKNIRMEYGNPDVLDEANLYNLSEDELYELVYRRVGMETPDVVVIIQPFLGLDLEGRENIVRHINTLMRKKIAVVIFAISLSDTLKVADRLYVFQNGNMLLSALPGEFSSIQEVLPLIR